MLVHIPTLWFYDNRRKAISGGGAQRWCRDAAEMLAKRGHFVRIYQKSDEAFRVQLAPSIEVMGLRAAASFFGNWAMARQIDRLIPPDAPVLFLSQELALSSRYERAVGVNHGIWWDGDMPRWKLRMNRKLQASTIDHLAALICVDTNYINWCHSELPGRSQWRAKLRYVPNYAETLEFQPGEQRERDGRIHVLFPRRMDGTADTDLIEHDRGAGFMLQAAHELKKRGVDFHVVFCGKGGLRDRIHQWAMDHGFGDQVDIREVAFDQMPELYADADVVVVPSLGHEGTSLSAVEGMASGKPVVVSQIGGLCNIVIPGVNGYVADLIPSSLADAIQDAARFNPLEDKAVLARVREQLGRARWEQRVWSILVDAFGLEAK